MNANSHPPRPPAELTVGTHLLPEDGACLMERVSALAEEPWTDHPVTTHPLLAHLGRLVNDAMSPIGRQALIALGPRLRGLDSKEPSISAAVAELSTGCALRLRPSLRLAWMHRAARHRLDVEAAGPGQARSAVSRLRRTVYDHGPAHRAVETAVIALARTPDADRDLLQLLERAVALLESHVGTGADCRAHVDEAGCGEVADGSDHDSSLPITMPSPQPPSWHHP